MTIDATNDESKVQDQKITDKELNFRAQEAKYERKLQEERYERERLAKEIEELKRLKTESQDDDDDDSEPYIDKKRLEKKLKNFEKNIDEKIDRRSEEKAFKMLEQREQENWLHSHDDFYDVMQTHAQTLYEKAPMLADAILKMPDNFERKKLVYHNIKSLGLDKPEARKSSIQETIDANRKSPYYQPSGISAAPYAPAGDFSEKGKKNAYEQLQKLKANLRLG